MTAALYLTVFLHPGTPCPLVREPAPTPSPGAGSSSREASAGLVLLGPDRGRSMTAVPVAVGPSAHGGVS